MRIHTPFGIRAAVPLARSPDLSQPAKKIMENPPEPWNPAPSPEPAPESILGTYCTRCGTKVPEGSGFCTKCGTPITGPGENPEVPVSAPLLLFLYLHPKKSARSTATSVLLNHSLRDQRRLFLSIRSRQPIPCQRSSTCTFRIRTAQNGRPGTNFHNQSSPSHTHHKEALYAKTLLPKRPATHPSDSLIHAHGGSGPSKKTLEQEKNPAGCWHHRRHPHRCGSSFRYPAKDGVIGGSRFRCIRSRCHNNHHSGHHTSIRHQYQLPQSLL